MAANVIKYVEEGYRKFQLKVGGKPFVDIDRIIAVREALDKASVSKGYTILSIHSYLVSRLLCNAGLQESIECLSCATLIRVGYGIRPCRL